jgi:tetratricopeptide (TPR) repeat protein
MNPERAEALNNLAWLLATHPDSKYRDASKSCELAERACKVTDYKKPDLLDSLAAAYASAGKFQKAIETAQQAIKLAQKDGNEALVQEISNRLEFYKAGRAYIQEEQPYKNQTE